jgi:hypothetical protein
MMFRPHRHSVLRVGRQPCDGVSVYPRFDSSDLDIVDADYVLVIGICRQPTNHRRC